MGFRNINNLIKLQSDPKISYIIFMLKEKYQRGLIIDFHVKYMSYVTVPKYLAQWYFCES